MTENGRAAQAALYGAPLGDILARCSAALGLNQTRLAALLGISTPMMSQLINARRVKIGNPTAVHRLQVLHDAVGEVERLELSVEEAIDRVEAIASGSEFFTSTTRRTRRDEVALEIQSLFRHIASATEFLAAADVVAEQSPAIAEMLRTYGAGRADEALAHTVKHAKR